MAQVSETGTETAQAPARRRRRRGLELLGLAIGIIAGVSIALAWLLPARYHDVPRPLGPLDRAFCRWPSAASILLVHARKE